MPLPKHLLERIPPLPVDIDKTPYKVPANLSSSFSVAASITRHHAKSFFFASHFLGSTKRKEAYSVYSYCRYVDDRIDEPADDETPPSKAELIRENQQFIEGQHPILFGSSFSWTCKQRDIPRILLDELVEGCCRDQSRVRIQTRTDLEEYCYLVASVVGLIMCRVFGVSSAAAYPHAVEMGLAMQLTNILRDIREDFEKDRIYLPAEELHERGISVEKLVTEGPDEAWKSYLAELIQTTRDWYQSAEGGIHLIQNRTCARTARIMGRVYGGILREIERADYDVRRRHFVPLRRKLRLAFSRS